MKAATSGEYIFKEANEQNKMVTYSGESPKVSIPISANNVFTTRLAKNAFRDKNVTHVTIPLSVGTVGKYCFANCVHLSEVSFEDEAIGAETHTFGRFFGPLVFKSNAFQACGIKAFVVPMTVTTIGDYCFSGCVNLSEVSFEEKSSNTRFPWECSRSYPITLGKSAFSGCGLEKVVIRREVVIGDDCFANCTHLAHVSFDSHEDDYPKHFGARAFSGCSSLVSFEFRNVWKLGDCCFEGCSSLAKISFEDCWGMEIGGDVFNGCPIVDVTVSAFDCGTYFDEHNRISYEKVNHQVWMTDDWFKPFTLKKVLLETIPSLASDKIKVTETRLRHGYEFHHDGENSTISYSGNLVNVTIPPSFLHRMLHKERIPYIEDPTILARDAFAGQNVRSVVIESNGNITRIDDGCFHGCTFLEEVTIGRHVRVIGSGAFRGCGLRSVTIPAKVEEIGDYCFSDCPFLTEIVFLNGENIKNIGEHAFERCPITSIRGLENKELCARIRTGESSRDHAPMRINITISDNMFFKPMELVVDSRDSIGKILDDVKKMNKNITDQYELKFNDRILRRDDVIGDLALTPKSMFWLHIPGYIYIYKKVHECGYNVFPVKFDPNHTLNDIRRTLAEHGAVITSDDMFITDRATLNLCPETPISKCCVKEGASIRVMKNYICTTSMLRSDNHCVEFELDWHVNDLQRAIYQETGIIPDEQYLIFSGRHINDNPGTLQELGFKSGSEMTVIARLRG